MNLTKKDLAKNISKEIEVPFELSNNIVSTFFDIKKKIIKSHSLKISKFGSYTSRITPKRIGRNPRTLKEYIISPRKRISFKASYKIKANLN